MAAINFIFNRISPFKIWLNSWATTPCNSSRFRYLMAPCVTPIAASLGELPAANAFIPSSLSKYISGTEIPEAIDISFTTFTSRFKSNSVELGGTCIPPNA